MKSLIKRILLEEVELKEQTIVQDIINWFYPLIFDNKLDYEFGCNEESLKNFSNLKVLYETLVEQGIIDSGDTIALIRGLRQKLYLSDNGTVKKEYLVSTGAKGFGNVNNSEKTPLGLCYIEKIITTDEKYESIIGGKETGVVLGPNQDGPREGHCAEVTTGSMVLSGAEPCNKNVENRFIYIHGTNKEKYLGKAASGGCIRVSNDDILELTDILGRGTYVYITKY